VTVEGQNLRRRMAAGIPLLGAHRGNAAECPENTLAAFRSAIELGVDLIECDVHLTADQRLAVIHDHQLDRTTNGRGLVRDHAMAQLQALDAGSWKDPRFRGERIPELREVLALARGRVGVAIEIKNHPIAYPGLEPILVEAVQAAGMTDQVIVISFDHGAIRRLHDLDAHLLTGALRNRRVGAALEAIPLRPRTLLLRAWLSLRAGRWVPFMVSRPTDILETLAAARAEVYCPYWAAIDPRTARALHQAGKLIGVWTVDGPVALAWSRALPANAILTNNPRAVRV
jgi:glycerophosphoryl diester phosphodiesterase